MSIINTQYTVEKSKKATFADGEQPSWLTEDTTGGSISYESANGGRAVLSTGTGAIDDLARLKTEPINVDVFDAVMLKLTFAFNDVGSDDENVVSQIQFRDDDESDTVAHKIGNNNPDRRHTIEISGNGNELNENTRIASSEKPLTSELLWDVSDDVVLHRYQDTFARRVSIPSDTQPDEALEYEGDILILTKDTASDREMFIYQIELAYLSKL